MKFVWATIQVENMEESLDFYQNFLKLPLMARYPAGPGMELAFLGNGDTQVELVANEGVKLENIGKGISMGFEVDSMEETQKAVKEKNICVLREMFQPNDHIRFFFVKDPSGYSVQLVEHL